MNVQAIQRMTVREFLAWAEGQDARYELVDGQTVAMAPERSEHVRAKRRAANALEAAIRHAGVPCEAFVEGLAVVVDAETSYLPDALVNCGERVAAESVCAPNPVVVVEVLSPSTRNLDKTAKLADYFRVPGLCHYLIVDLGRRRVVHYSRQADEVITVAILQDGEITLDPPGLSLAASSLFV
ncbi:MAG: Uma2 family endonuclease [Xanthobacteraceae bacterium]|jgi:Uma2 family endonuclease